MIRFILRFAATVSLAAAVIFAVLDATRSIAASALIVTPLSVSWASVSPDTLFAVQEMIGANIHTLLWDPIVVAILSLPGFLLFAVVALIFYALGRRPEKNARRLAY